MKFDAFANSLGGLNKTKKFIIVGFGLALITILLGTRFLPAYGAPVTTTFTTTEDTFVNGSSPTATAGTSTTLKVKPQYPIETAYLKFNVFGLSGPVDTATLRVYANSGLAWGFDAYTVPSNSWNGATMNYNTRAALGTKLGSFPSGNITGWISVSVKPAITSNGTYSFGLVGTYWQEISLASRENAALAPQLVITTTGAPDTTPPSNPTNLSVGTATTTSLPLSWSASTDDVGVAGYDLYKDGNLISTTGSTSTVFSGLSCGTTYNLGVDAYDAAGNKSGMASASGTTGSCPDTEAPTKPSELVVTGSSENSVSLSWTASTDNVGVTGYSLYKEGGFVGTTSSTNNTFSGLACGTPYSFGVDAYDSAGNHSTQGTYIATTDPCDTNAPSVPANLSLTSASTSSVSVQWDASTDDRAVTGYRIYFDGTLQSNTTTTSYSKASLACGTSHSVAVDAFDAAGNHSAAPNITVDTLACPPDTTPPSAPSSLSLSNITRTSASLNWVASTDNVNVTGYTLYLDGNSVGNTTSTTYGFSGLTCATNYVLGVEAFDAASNVSTRATIALSTSGCVDQTPPTTPTGLNQTGSTQNSISVGWNPSTDNLGVTGYDVYLDGVLQTGTSNFSLSKIQEGSDTDRLVHPLALASGIAAGHTAFLVNSSTVDAGTTAPGAPGWGGIDSITDNRGNTWVRDVYSPTDSTNVFTTVEIWRSEIANSLQPGDTLSVTGDSRGLSMVYSIYNVTGLVPNGLDKTHGQFNNFTTSFTSGNTATTSNADEFLIGAFGASNPGSAAWITPAAGWTEQADQYAGGNIARAGAVATRVVSATGAYAAAGTAKGNYTGASVIATYLKTTAITGTSATFGGLTCGSSHTVSVDAYDAIGNKSPQATLTAVAAACPDNIAPTVNITSPTTGTNVSGSVNLTVNATDNVAVAGVQYKLDGNNLGTEVLSAPFSSSWNSAQASNGNHVLTAVARDSSNNLTTSASVNVSVSNGVAPAPSAVPAANVNGVTVGGGFIEASARQVVRTASNTVYVMTADDNPCQVGSTNSGVIRIWKGSGAQAANANVPTAFAEQDITHHPVSTGTGSCVFSAGVTSTLLSPDMRLDPSGTIHLAYIDGKTKILYYQTYSTSTDTWGAKTQIATAAQTNSGSGWPRGGQVAFSLDANNIPFVAFATNGTANTIRVTNKLTGSWSTPVTIASGTNEMHPTMVTSLDGTLHLAWLDNSLAAHATIKYARYASGVWGAAETVSSGDSLVLANGNDDQGPSIATDSQNRPHVLYMDGTVNGSDNYVRMRYRTTGGVWTDNTPPGGAGGTSNASGTWYAHTPQNYISSLDTDFVFLGHDNNVSPGGYQYQTGGAGSSWSAYATIDPRNQTNTTAGAAGLDGSASIRFDPLRDNNPGIIDLIYYDENDGTAGYSHHATVYYKAIQL